MTGCVITKKPIVLLLPCLCLLILVLGCQKAPEIKEQSQAVITEEQSVDQLENEEKRIAEQQRNAEEESARQFGNAEADQPSQPSSDPQNIDRNKLVSHAFLNRFQPYGLEPETVVPSFATAILDKNGSFASTRKGPFVYFKLPQKIDDDALLHYYQTIFKTIQSKADNHRIYTYDANTEERGEIIEQIVSAAQPLSITYQSDGKWLALYAAAKDYQPGFFANINETQKALYLTIME